MDLRRIGVFMLIMRMNQWTFIAVLSLAPILMAHADEGTLRVGEVLEYQATPLVNPKGGEKFSGSNFIHPLKTPSGFVVTETQPADHMHHFGLWWPWKFLKVGEEKVLFWELQKGEGVIQAVESQKTESGFTAKSIYLDKKSGDEPQVVLNETVECTVSAVTEKPVRGYDLDIKITQKVAVDQPVEVVKYRYSGFTYRGTAAWNRKNSTLLTSEGKSRKDSHTTRAKWVRVEGEAKEGKKAGVLMMSAPSNHQHPERLRTWNGLMHHGAFFINMNPVQEASWKLKKDEDCVRQYRVHVYDGSLSAEEAEAMWQHYAKSLEKKP